MNLQHLKNKALSNPKVKSEYEHLAEEFHFIEQLLNMRTQAGLTQEQVAQRMQTQKSNISRLERGNTNPSWATLSKYAAACGFTLQLSAHKTVS